MVAVLRLDSIWRERANTSQLSSVRGEKIRKFKDKVINLLERKNVVLVVYFRGQMSEEG